MVVPQRRGRLITIQELLDIQREGVPTRCAHCQRDATDRDRDQTEAALRARVRVLEARVSELERTRR
ncbi:MAG TPA: hypothetical protein VLM79_40855 [Kofleriaceae bacterium]|nr:hypothetical protein [Kofleriaceae bacterium]